MITEITIGQFERFFNENSSMNHVITNDDKTEIHSQCPNRSRT